MKIPFDIKYRQQIESGEYKVVTTKEQSVRIICWDRSTTYWKIVALVLAPDGKTENPFTYDVNGNESDGCLHNHEFDLFIITPDLELSEFEHAYMRIVHKMKPEDFNDEGLKIAKEEAAELLAIARKEFIKQGYIIEKKAFHDAVEKINDKHKAEMSVEYSLHCKVENRTRHAVMNWDTFQKVAQKFIDIGKAEAVEKYKQSWFNEGKIAGRFEGLTEDEKYQQGVHDGKENALKDLPRWDESRFEMDAPCVNLEWLHVGKKMIYLPDLEKLPGFNED